MARPLPTAATASAVPATTAAHDLAPDVRLADADRGKGPPPPALPASAPFMLRVHPARIGVVAGKVVPICGRIALQRGVGNVDQNRAGAFVVAQAIREAEESGWTVIPFDVDGPGTNYLREIKPGTFALRFERAFSGAAQTEPDLDAYTAWLRGLMDRGVIPRPSGWALSRLRGTVEREIADIRDAAVNVPSLRHRLAGLEADLVAIDAEIASVRGAAVAGRVPEIATQ